MPGSQTFLLKVDTGYYRSTPNGRYGRWDANEKTALPLCNECMNKLIFLLSKLEIQYSIKPWEAFEVCPNCKGQD